MGRTDEGLAQTAAALEVLTAGIPAGSPPLVNAGLARGHVLLAAGRAEDAAAFLGELVGPAREALPEGHSLLSALDALMARATVR